MKWKLIVTIARSDGTTFQQNIQNLTEEESSDQSLIHRLLKEYKQNLGKGYYIVYWYVGW